MKVLCCEWLLFGYCVWALLGGYPDRSIASEFEKTASDDLVLEEVTASSRDAVEDVFISLTSGDRFTSRDYEVEYANMIEHLEIDLFDIVEESMDMDVEIHAPKTVARWIREPLVTCTNVKDPTDTITLAFGDEVEVLVPFGTEGFCELLFEGEVYYINRDYLSDQAPKIKLVKEFELTAYAWTGNRCANGRFPRKNYTVAAHKDDFPLGTKLYIEDMGVFTVEDRGGFKRGVIDIYMADRKKCIQFGRRKARVYIIMKGDNKRYKH